MVDCSVSERRDGQEKEETRGPAPRSRGTGPVGWTVATSEVPIVDLQADDAERAPQGHDSVTVVQGQEDVVGVTNVGGLTAWSGRMSPWPRISSRASSAHSPRCWPTQPRVAVRTLYPPVVTLGPARAEDALVASVAQRVHRVDNRRVGQWSCSASSVVGLASEWDDDLFGPMLGSRAGMLALTTSR